MRYACIIGTIIGVFLAYSGEVCAAETDQYLALDVELDDSAEVLNRYLNERAEEFLALQNARRHPVESPEELASKYYHYLFNGIHRSRLRSWLNQSEEIDRHPDRSVSYFRYLRMSIFRTGSFPFILPMARTIRIGDVHLGVDKIGHFFGVGRREFKHYLKLRAKGVDENEAMEKVIMHGYQQERFILGHLTDAIFSYADLEANYQGVMMARALCEGDDAYFKQVDGVWGLTRPIDIVPFVTPDFDETYNKNRYYGSRKRQVFKALRRDHCEKFDLPIVQERFRKYDECPQSFSQDVIDRRYAKRGKDPRKEQAMEFARTSDE